MSCCGGWLTRSLGKMPDCLLLLKAKLMAEGTRSINRGTTICDVSPDCKTEKQARERAEAKLQAVVSSRKETGLNLRLGEFVRDRYFPEVETLLKISTRTEYKRIWSHYLEPLAGEAWLRDVRTSDIKAWLRVVGAKWSLSKSMLFRFKALLSGIFNLAIEQDCTDKGAANPVKAFKLRGFADKKKKTYAYSLDVVLDMLRVCDSLRDSAPSAAVAIAAFAGLRKGELQGLRWRHLTPDYGILNVQQSIWHGRVGEPKNEASKSSVPVISALALRLDTYRRKIGNPASGPVLPGLNGGARCLDALYRRHFREPFKAAKIQWSGWHSFRRGLGTNLSELGIPDLLIQTPR
jgi:integrase